MVTVAQYLKSGGSLPGSKTYTGGSSTVKGDISGSGSGIIGSKSKSSSKSESTTPTTTPQQTTQISRGAISSGIAWIQNKYSGLDKQVFAGYLPGGYSRNRYKAETAPLKDYWETQAQMSVLADKESDNAYKLMLEQQKADYQKNLQQIKAMQDVYNKNLLESLGLFTSPTESAYQAAVERSAYNDAMTNFGSTPAQASDWLNAYQTENPSWSDKIGTGLQWGIPIALGLAAIMIFKKK